MADNQNARLLLTLKVTIEAVVERNVPHNMWHVYGGLTRVCTALIDILTHYYKISDKQGNADLWIFIQGLTWLKPSLSHWEPTQSLHYPAHVQGNKGLLWVYWHVENHIIVDKLSWLLSDREHLVSCYDAPSYMLQNAYTDALLICLNALANNQLALLSDVDPPLYVVPSQTIFKKSHRRCWSLPQNMESQKREEMEMVMSSSGIRNEQPSGHVVSGVGVVHGTIPRRGSFSDTHKKINTNLKISKKCSSLPCLLSQSQNPPMRLRSQTVSKISPSALTVDYQPEVVAAKRTYKRRARAQKKSFMNLSVKPAATGNFPRPAQGQTLASFLSSGSFTSAQLDRENAHFRISEAMISAIEQVKCNRALRVSESRDPGSSSEGGSRQWRRRRSRETVDAKPIGSWGDRDTTTSEMTPSPPTSSDSGDSDTEAGSDAEQLALSLLKQFGSSEYQLPRADELQWLVGAGDTPQELLPLPGAWPVDKPQASTSALRGTADWAPPRPQLILTVHPPPKKKLILGKQKLRCAGCGCRVAPEYASRYRYCDYLGRYFCTACHTNQLSVVPARVIHHWDFNRFAVSTFSFELIEEMMTDGLFRIDDLNPALYKKIKALDKTRTYRLQLHYLKDFLLTCRFAQHLQELVAQQPSYSLSEPDKFSLNDLLHVKSGDLPTHLCALVKTGLAHVDTCELCQARGFLCELCSCRAVIFPWHLHDVTRCTTCGACYHIRCFKPPSCPRCIRIAERKAQLKK